MFYLLKTEPSVYSFTDLQRDGTTVWDGVTNPTAVKNLREMNSGDQLVIYHTGDQKQVVGTAVVLSVDTSDPRKPLVKIKSGKPLTGSLNLSQMKSNPRFKDSPLVRQSRLSVVPLTDSQHKILVGK
jgi:predicted RNA-binding protein with PUA-like domain